jgi:hypothetical protein
MPRGFIDTLLFLQSKIDPGADDLEPVTVVQGNLRQWHDEIERLRSDYHFRGLCATCKTPLSRDCRKCQKLWES